MPPKRFDVCRHEWLKADGMAKSVWMESISILKGLENANKQVLVGIRAQTADILTESGQVIMTHRRGLRR